MFSELIQVCQFLLKNFPEAQSCQDYLNSRISPKTQDLFQLGYFPPIDYFPSITNLFDCAELNRLRLVSSYLSEDASSPKKYIKWSHFSDQPIIFPFKDAHGKIVGLVGRTIAPNTNPKYKNTSFAKGNYLFGLFENKKSILDADAVYIVEGQFDVMKATEKGLKNIVAIGSADMTNYQFSLITRYTNNFYLLLDNDDAGNKGRNLITKKYNRFANVQNRFLPPNYKDIDEFLSSNKIEDLPFSI